MTAIRPADNMASVTAGGFGADWPGVSVVMPVLNEERHLEAAVRRVPGAGLSRPARGASWWSGPSNDRTRQIADDLAAADPRVRVVDNPAARTPHALNLGIRGRGLRHRRPGRRARRADRRLHPAGGRTAGRDRRGQRRRGDGCPGHDAVRAGGGHGVHDPARPRRCGLPPGRPRRPARPRPSSSACSARRRCWRSAGSTRPCTGPRTGS